MSKLLIRREKLETFVQQLTLNINLAEWSFVFHHIVCVNGYHKVFQCLFLRYYVPPEIWQLRLEIEVDITK